MTVHLVLAWLVAVLALVVAGLAAWGVARGSVRRFAIDRAILATETAVVLAVASGAWQLVQTSGPSDGLHLVYGIVATIALPIARGWRGLSTGPRPLPIVLAAIVLLGVVVRLAQTG